MPANPHFHPTRAACHADAFELLAVYASFVQTQGLAQGAFFDPASFQPLVQSPAMSAALRVLRRLYAFGACVKGNKIETRVLGRALPGRNWFADSVKLLRRLLRP